MLKAVAIN